MNCIWPSRKVSILSTLEHESTFFPGVRFGIRRGSLGQRIDLAKRTADIMRQNEFLRAGSALDQVQAEIAELLARRVFLEWGLVWVKGIRIDGRAASVSDLIERGPVELCDEIVERIRGTLQLDEDERKNS